MKRTLAYAAILIALCTLAPQTQSQEKKSTAPMMDSMAVKKKMMEPETMMAAEKAMMSDKSMVPSMMAKEMMIHDMMKDEKSMSMLKKATMAAGTDNAMMDETKVKMASDMMMKDKSQLEMLFQELVARHLVSQKMAMMPKSPAGSKPMTKPMMMDEKIMMDGKKEIMAGEAMSTMMLKEMLLKALMKDSDVMAMVEKQAKMLQEPAMAKMIGDESMMMKSEGMGKDPAMMKGMVKDAMIRHISESNDMKKEKK